MAPINPHTPITDRSTPPTSRSSTTPRVATRVDIELTCLMCGRDLGMLESEVWPNHGSVVLHLSRSRSVLITDWRRLRCSCCGGAAMPGEITHRLVRTEAPLDWSSERPRRGRPPKSVAAQQQLDDESA
jgi:hypothetical protein